MKFIFHFETAGLKDVYCQMSLTMPTMIFVDLTHLQRISLF